MAKYTKDMPKDVKGVWGMGIAIILGAGIVVLVIPTVIFIVAFPESLLIIAALVVLLIGGYKKARP